MKTQVVKMIHKGIWTVVLDDTAKINPYKIYRTRYENGNKHRTKQTEYTDFYSCLCYLANRVYGED